MENKRKHLDYIQAVVNRMAANSFLLKGWSVTLVAGLMALSFTANEKIAFVSISFLPVLVFWGLDGYYLWQERLFRSVYDHVRRLDEDEIDFAMTPAEFVGGRNTWLSATFSRTVAVFYGALAVVMGFVIVFLSR